MMQSASRAPAYKMAQHTFRVSLPTSVNTIKKTLHRHAHGQSDPFIEKVLPGDSELWQVNWNGPPSLFRTWVSHSINGQIKARISITSNAGILVTHLKNSSVCSFDVAWASNIWQEYKQNSAHYEWLGLPGMVRQVPLWPGFRQSSKHPNQLSVSSYTCLLLCMVSFPSLLFCLFFILFCFEGISCFFGFCFCWGGAES